MPDTTYIYSLRDPRTGEIRYVGASVNPASRLRHHVSPGAQRYGARALQEWIGELGNHGSQPELLVLEKVPARSATEGAHRHPDVVEAEKRWIVRLLDEGHELTNQHMAWVRAEEDQRLIDEALERGRQLFGEK